MATPTLPPRFPCWVKAVYSWGGESKRDLGFMEGDFIECLNAGDGMWWMGRLRRDRRMVGLFPSNFVKVLDEDSQPAPQRSTLNTPPGSSSRSNSQNTSGPTTPQPSKSLFRKPFQSYAKAGAPNPEAAARELQSRTPGGTPNGTPPGSVNSTLKTKPYSSMHKPKHSSTPPQSVRARPLSPTIPAPIARASSPLPPPHSRQPSRAPSPLPPDHSDQLSRAQSSTPYSHQHQNQQYYSRSPSPTPQHYLSRQPSPAPQDYYEDEEESSPPPPPPPAHRVAYNRAHSPEHDFQQQHNYDQQHIPQTPSPAVSGRSGGMTPSPLRDAMNDVMTSLDGMSVPHEDESEQERGPVNPWSPEAFDEIYHQRPTVNRPHTSMAIGRQEEDDGEGHYTMHQDANRNGQSDRLDSYVQRMESRLNDTDVPDEDRYGNVGAEDPELPPPPPPQRGGTGFARPGSSYSQSRPGSSQADSSRPSSSYATSGVGPGRQNTLKSRKSAFELGRDRLNRTFTTKSSVTTASSAAQSSSTNNSSSTQATSQSIMSGYSAGGFSATSAGSLARRKFGRSGSTKEGQRPMSAMGLQAPAGGVSTVSYHSSHDSQPSEGANIEPDAGAVGGLLGGLSAPVAAAAKKRGFFGKMVDSVKTGAASARSKSNVSTPYSSRPQSRQNNLISQGISSMSSRPPSRGAAKDMGLGGTGDWVQMRRDVNRTNSLSRNERNERIERCQMTDVPVLTPVETLQDNVEGDEGMDGEPVPEPTDIGSCNFSMVDKSARFVNSLPALINSASLAQGYLCRPYRSDVQKLRAIFTWVAEKITWEEDFEGGVDTRRVIQSKRGCSEEIAALVAEMCSAISIHTEIVRGHLKIPGEVNFNQDLNDIAARPNHWWNAVIADGEWRILDCSLANPSNPRRAAYSSAGNQMSEGWWFLARPTEICYTHVPLLPEQQHIVPPVAHDVLMALPIACPPYFTQHLQMWDFDTSLVNLEGLEMAHVQLNVPEDVECIATVSARSFTRDSDGDYFESGDHLTKPALAQGDFISCDSSAGEPFKRYTIKAFVPSSASTSPSPPGSSSSTANTATLHIHAGRRGLMHSLAQNPHPLALSLPLTHHAGQNPPFDFFTRHPTPHALRHELYVTGPLCRNLAFNNTFVFGVRQHPSSANWTSFEKQRPGSPNPRAGAGSAMSLGRPGSAFGLARPGSAMSMASISASGSAYSNPSATGSDNSSSSGTGQGGQANAQKPAKLAIQSPSGKILRMTRKAEPKNRVGGVGPMQAQADEDGIVKVGSNWETIIKIGERGVWRALVLADRSARWCVFGEWECV